MLLNLLKQRSGRNSHRDQPSQQDSTLPILKDSTSENLPNSITDDKLIQDQKSNQLMNALLNNNKRGMAATFTGTTDHSAVPLQENNPFKKRVENYFKQYDNVSLQQKLRTLAPTTINNVTMTTNRNNPLTTKPFLMAPFERNTELDKKFTSVDQQKIGLAKGNAQHRQSSVDTRKDWLGNSEVENTHAQDSTLTSNITKGGKKGLDTSTRGDKKLVGIRIPSYTSIDRESVEGKSEKTRRRGESVKHSRPGAGDQTKTRRRDSLDSDSCLNFRTASTLRNRYGQGSEEDIFQKEGSLLRYFRAKQAKQRPASTNKGARRPMAKLEPAEPVKEAAKSPVRAKTAFNRVRGKSKVENEEREEKEAGSVDTSFEGFSVLDSFNISETINVTRPTTTMDKIQLKPIGNRNAVTGMNTTLFSSHMNEKRSGDSMDGALLPDEENQLNYSDDDDLHENSIGQLSANESQGIINHKNLREISQGLSLKDKHNGFLMKLKNSKRYDSPTFGRGSSSKSSSPQSKIKEDLLSNRGPITERLSEENEQVPSKAFEEKKTGEVAMIKNMSDLVAYVRQKGQQLGGPQESSRLTAKFNEALAIADIVKSRGGVVQKPLRSSMEIILPRVLRKDGNEMEEAYGKIEEVTETISTFRDRREQSRQQHRVKIEQAKIASVKRLTNTELEILREEFLGNGNKEIDVERIDVFLKRLKFFSDISQEIRLNFYKNAIYLQQKKGDFIFNQGDEGNLMYVILRGSVNVKLLKTMKDGQSQIVNVNSLYDGTHFGELAIMGPLMTKEEEIEENDETKQSEKQSEIQTRLSEIDKLISERYGRSASMASPSAAQDVPAKRSASIQCSEETELLAINREKFQEILYSVMEKDLDAKVKVLLQVPFFKNETGFNLMPIANLLQIKQYKLGQRVVRAGEPLLNFYLVAQGKCKVISEISDQYTLDVDVYKDKLKPFKFNPGKAKKAAEPEDGLRRPRDLSNPMRRTFDNELFCRNTQRGVSAEKREKFTKHVFFNELNSGNCFGFRPLLKTDEENRYLADKENYAKLSVVAESPIVEIYVLPRASLMLVPERLKNLLLDGVAETKDFDECDVLKPIKEHQTWRKLQLDIIKNALVKTDHPNLKRNRDGYKAK